MRRVILAKRLPSCSSPRLSLAHFLSRGSGIFHRRQNMRSNRSTVVGFLALAALAWLGQPAAAQETKSARGTVSAMATDSLLFAWPFSMTTNSLSSAFKSISPGRRYL